MRKVVMTSLVLFSGLMNYFLPLGAVAKDFWVLSFEEVQSQECVGS